MHFRFGARPEGSPGNASILAGIAARDAGVPAPNVKYAPSKEITWRFFPSELHLADVVW